MFFSETGKPPVPFPLQPRRIFFARSSAAAGFTLAVVATFGTAPVLAEGSRSLYPSGYETAHTDDGRANLALAGTGTIYLNVVPARTFIYVYAQAGEHILTGSRNRTANNVGNIHIFNPQSFGTRGFETIPASPSSTCSAGTNGLIDTRAKELLGPQSVDGSGNTAGYVPCFYQAPTTGIYGVLFGVDASGGGANGAVDPPAISNSSVSAWDVTVRGSSTGSTADIDGRVFTYAFSNNTGGNGSGRRIYSSLFYVTDDGYRYKQSLQGIDPNAGTFFANPLGFRDQGQPLYKDIRGTNQPVSNGLPAGVTADNAQYPIFFSDITPGVLPGVTQTLGGVGVPGTLGITLSPKPPQVNSFSFSYPPSSSSTSFVGQGGTFNFTVTDTISIQIVISRDGLDFDPANPVNRVLTGTSGTGPYSVVWDGRDNAGNNFPVGSNYQFRITGRNGEAHFPFVDVEGNLYGGPTVTKLNGNVQDSIVYYDDRGYVTKGGTAVGTLNGQLCGQPTWPQPTPAFSLSGLDSSAKIYNNGSGPNSAYARWWPDSGSNANSDCNSISQYFGDTKALNLWTYQTTTPQASTLNVIDAADVRATISAPVGTTAGAGVTVNVGFGNVGSQTAAGVTYQVALPPGLSGVGCNGAACSYDSAGGVVTITGLPTSLSAGQSVNLSLSYTAPASGSVNAFATVATTTSEGPNLAPNSAGATTTVGGSNAADVLTSVMPPPAAAAGGTVTVPVSFGNVGATTAAITGYGLTLPTGLSNVACSAGVTCTYNPGSGVVTVTGLPASLDPGQNVGFSLTYTAPGAGVQVPVTSTLTTSAMETNTANNTSSGTTTTIGQGNQPDVLASVAAPMTAAPGSAVSVPVTFGNVGDVTAAGLNYSLTLPGGLSGVGCPSPAVCTYDSGTGAVAVTGLPTALAAGSYASLTLRYTAPPSGVVPASAAISTTTTGETNTGNNNATGKTTVVTASAGADVTVTITPPANAAPGATVNVPVSVANLGPLDAAGVTYSANLAPGLAGVSCNAPVTCTYATGSGVVTVTGLPTTLASGQSVPFTLTYTAPGSGQVPVNATISTATFDPNTGNNAASGSTVVATGAGQADVTTSVSPPASAVSGAAVSVPVSFSNVGTVAADGVTYRVALTGSPTGITVRNGGTACSYAAGTGAITGCGLPTTLTPGQSLNLTVGYTAPATGPVQIMSTITTTTAESNANNNSATASTALSPAPASDLSIALSGLPATATAGSPYSGSFSCTNVGNAAASAGTTCSVSGLPTGLTAGACTIRPPGASWSAGTAVPANAVVTCGVTGTPVAAGSYTVTGSTGATGDSNTANNTATKALTVSPAGASSTDVLTTVQPPPSAARGATVTVPVTFANVGVSTVPITSYGLTLPSGLTGVSCSGSGVGCSYDSGSGAVVLSGLPTTLAAGTSVPFSLTYTAPAAGTQVPVMSVIATSATETNTANNSASGTTTTVGNGAKPDVVASLMAPSTATPGSTVNVPVTFGNVGDVSAAGLSYTLTLPGGLSDVTCAAPASCGYASGTGIVTVTGLPTSLASGAFANVALSFTAPASGVVATQAIIATSTTGETNTTNNSATTNTTVVLAAAGADVRATLAVQAEAAPGQPVSVPLTVANLGPATADNVTYTIGLPPGLTDVSCSPPAICTYAAGTGVVTVTGLLTSLAVNQSVPFTLTYTSPNAGQLPVNASISTSTFDPNTGNNTASGTTVVGLADVTTSVLPPAGAVAGQAVSAPVSFSNTGAVGAAGVTYNVTLSGASGNVAIANGGAACGFDAGTGAVTGCGLPTMLGAGQAVNLTLSYTAPATGLVGVASTITTTTAESDTGNNRADGSTSVTAAAAPDLGINLSGLPATATVGVPYSGSFSCTNGGGAPASAGTSCSVTGLPAGVAVGGCTVGPSNAVWNAGAAVAAGQTVTCTVAGTPTAAGSSAVTGSTGAAGDTNAGNDTARATIAASAAAPSIFADVLTTVSPPAVAEPGSTVSVPVTFANVGVAGAVITGYALQLPAGLANVGCGGGVIGCIYDSGTGAVVLSGLASPLVSGQRIAFTLNYTAPAAGTKVVVRSTIATSTPESNMANNEASGTTVAAGVQPIPTLSEWALLALGSLLLLAGMGGMRRQRRV